jgi:hypothetical protein
MNKPAAPENRTPEVAVQPKGGLKALLKIKGPANARPATPDKPMADAGAASSPIPPLRPSPQPSPPMSRSSSSPVLSVVDEETIVRKFADKENNREVEPTGGFRFTDEAVISKQRGYARLHCFSRFSHS